MAIHIGRVRAGWLGLLVAGVSFILPAALMMVALAWTYVRYGAQPQIAALLYGVKPLVIVVIAQGAYRLARSAVKSAWLGIRGAMALAASALGVDPLKTLFGAGIVAALIHLRQEHGTSRGFAGAFSALALTTRSLSTPFSVRFSVPGDVKDRRNAVRGWLRTGRVSSSDLVTRFRWLTERQLLDAVAAGQITPGPLFTTATFIGYLLSGIGGAVAATIGIFQPAFVLVALSGPLVPRLRRSPLVAAALDGINLAALALMVVVSAQLARTAIVDWPSLVIGFAGAVLLFRYRVNSGWLIAGGAAAGALAMLARVWTHGHWPLWRRPPHRKPKDCPTPRSIFYTMRRAPRASDKMALW